MKFKWVIACVRDIRDEIWITNGGGLNLTGDNWKTPLIQTSETGHSVTPLKDATDALKETKKVVEFGLGEV